MNRRSVIVSALALTTALTAPNVALAVVDEIHVTATRREQSLIEVPYNISAYSSEDLEKSRVYDLSDFSRMVPGLAFSDQGPAARGNNNTFILRGLNANAAAAGNGTANQTVAPVSTYFGEVPVFFPMTLNDIERVEVLRGPQGTLYGSGAAGGAIRFIPKAPDPSGYYSEVSAEMSTMNHSDDLNRDINGVVNVPISEDKLALRLVGGYEELGGFIDANGLVELDGNGEPVPSVLADPTSGFVLKPKQEDVNGSTSWFVRTGLLFKPSDTVNALLTYHHQRDEQDNQQVHNPDFDGGSVDISTAFVPGGLYTNGATVFPDNRKYEQSALIDEPYERDFDLINLDVTADFAFSSLSISTSYYENASKQVRDVTGFFETPAIAYYYGFYPRMTVPDLDVYDDKGFVEEVRLVSNWDRRVNYVLGAFYQSFKSDFSEEQDIPGINDFFIAITGFPGANPQLGDLIFTLDRKFKFNDTAIFGELSFDVTDQWQITGGIRAFWQDTSIDFSQTLPFCGALCAEDLFDSLGSSSASVKKDFSDQVLKFNTSYRFNEDLMTYFTYSEGFRRGGANGVPINGLFASLPQYLTYSPDKAKNYEVGLKGRTDRIIFSAAAYYIEWDGFQFDDFTPGGFSVVINGDEATSRGVEFEASGQLTDNLSFEVGYAYTDTEVTKSFTIEDLAIGGLFTFPETTVSQITVFNGDPLPGVPEHSFTVAADYVQNLSNSDMQLTYHVNGSYRGDTQSTFNDVTQGGRQYFKIDSFAIWDASVTLERDLWSVALFVDNLTDEVGTTAGLANGLLGDRGAIYYVTRPRTIGVRVSLKTG